MAFEQDSFIEKTSGIFDRYCVFGNPIMHSKSPILHTEFAKQQSQDLTYTAKCIEVNNFAVSAKQFFDEGGKGLNITVPFKHDAHMFATDLTRRAVRAGAVNTLYLNENHLIVGDNTDGIGLVSDITEHLNWDLKNKDILIMGAGGAVRGILEPFINELPKSITIVNRTKEKAQKLANDFSDIFSIRVCSYSELFTINEPYKFDIIINGSSSSLAGELPSLPISIISNSTCCYDMMYAKDSTPFLLWSKENGAHSVSDGLGMLVCQGAESFFIWRGVKPQTQPVIKLIRSLL
jgi:shikimate dehydrogenase